MKALVHLRNRFDYASRNSGTLRLTQTDIDALQQLINEENSKQRNTSLEDALLLFYLLKCYKVQNENNKAVLREKPLEEINFPMGMPDAMDIMRRITMLIDPKEEVIRKITDELWIYQQYESIPKDRDVYLKEMYREQNWEQNDHLSTLKVTPQKMIPIKKEERITYQQVEELLNDLLKKAKEEFPKLKLWNEGYKFKEVKPLSSADQQRSDNT
jgi:hypothetical protein